jgi:hypothetical protein
MKECIELMRARLIILCGLLAVVAVTACTRRLDPEAPCNFVQNSDLLRVSWDHRTPVKLYIHSSMPLAKYPEMAAILRESVKDWNDVAGREVLRVEAFNVGGSDLPKKDGYSMIYWLNSWEDGKTTEQARTTIYWSGSQIYEADIRINARDHTFYVGRDSSFSGVDFKSLMIHELGHALGLAHTTAIPSVMNVSLNDGVNRRTISKLDIDSVRCEY